MRSLFAAALLSFTAITAHADDIERACLSSERKGVGRQLCACIQNVADRTLSAPDQRLAASFFKDPDRAQKVRQSSSRSKEEFWERYRTFGRMAQKTCQS